MTAAISPMSGQRSYSVLNGQSDRHAHLGAICSNRHLTLGIGAGSRAVALRGTGVAGQTVQVPVQIVEEPDAERVAAAARTLKLLADETRLRIIWNLLHGEHSVNALAAHLSMQPAAVSHHLAKLRSAGVVTTRRDGNRIFYAAHDDHVEALVQEALHHAEHLAPYVAHHERGQGRA